MGKGFFDADAGASEKATEEETPKEGGLVAAAVPNQATKSPSISDAEIEEFLFKEQPFQSNICCLLYGTDNTGKSGIVMDFLNEEDIKAGNKMLILDLDGGCMPVLNKYHKDKLKNIIVRNPLTFGMDENGDSVTDYKATLNWIKSIVKWTKANYEKQKIKAIVFDGLSTLLSHAEYIMRVERNIQQDGGVSTRYWIIRMRIFTEIMEQMKSIPIARFFIAHEDFIASSDKDLSAAKRKTNQMVFQKIRCLRLDTPDKVVFRAIIDKSKDNSSLEGYQYDFCTVDKATKKAEWSGRKVIEKFMK